MDACVGDIDSYILICSELKDDIISLSYVLTLLERRFKPDVSPV